MKKQKSSELLRTLRHPTRLIKMSLPRFGELMGYAGKDVYMFWLAFFMGIAVFALQITAGSQLQSFVDNAVHNPSSFNLFRALLIFWLFNNVGVPGIQSLMMVLLDRFHVRIITNLTDFVHKSIQKIRLQDLPIRGMETLMTTQINSIWDGLKQGQAKLIVNIGALLGSLVLLWQAWGFPVGPIVTGALVLLVILINQFVGLEQYKSLALALSTRSLTERLLRHLVRPRGLFYHWRHDDAPTQDLLEQHLESRRSTSVTADQWSATFSWVGVAVLSMVILSPAIPALLVSKTLSSATLASIVLLLTQSEKLISGVDALTSAIAESQGIEVGAARLHREILDKPQMPRLDQDKLDLLLGGKLLIQLASVRSVDIYTGLEVLNDVNASFESGQVVLLHGGHKSGKTEFADVITGVNLPVLGDVFINGISVSRLPFSALGIFPKKVFNHELSVRETLGVEQFEERKKTLQELRRKRKTARGCPSALERDRSQKVRVTMARVNHLAKVLGVDQVITTLPSGYDTLMVDVVRYLSQDQLWVLAFMRNLVLAERVPKLLILDQSIDELTDPDTIRRVIKLVNMLAHQLDMVVLITTALKPDDLDDYGLKVDVQVDLDQFRPVEPSVIPNPAMIATAPVVARAGTVYHPFGPSKSPAAKTVLWSPVPSSQDISKRITQQL